jgi:dCTP deaminase
MILSDRDIKKMMQSGRIKITPAPELKTQLQPASLDLRLSSKFRVFKSTATPYIDPQDPNTFNEMTELTDVADGNGRPLLPHMKKGPRPFVIHPGEFVLGMTKEFVELPDDITARVEGRSSLGRLGIIIHSTAGYIDPGFSGNITLEITNIGSVPVLLHPDMRICQLAFETMSTPAEVDYAEKGGKYAGATEPGQSKITEDA